MKQKKIVAFFATFSAKIELASSHLGKNVEEISALPRQLKRILANPG